MVLKLTNKEAFLISVTQYLSNNYLPREIDNILDNKDRFLQIDILQDELDYFDLTLEDFKWY
jgi:hypothetical protein